MQVLVYAVNSEVWLYDKCGIDKYYVYPIEQGGYYISLLIYASFPVDVI